MDAKHGSHQAHQLAAPAGTSHGKKHLLIVVNCVLLCLGCGGGPIFLRLYYLHGGRLQWLTSFLQTAGFPLLLIPLFLSRLQQSRRSEPSARLLHLPLRLLLASFVIGLLTGLLDFLYAYGLTFLPVSTSAVLVAAQLVFTVLFAFIIVRQRFTPFSVNAVALLTVGAMVLALGTNGDRPAGVSAAGYWKGFALTLAAAALYGLVLPLMEFAYSAAGKPVTYSVVMEMQLIICFVATAFCAVGMIVNRDFQAIAREAAEYGLGKGKYYAVIIGGAFFWQCFFVGVVGVIFCVNTLLAGIIIAAFIPILEVLGLIFLHEKFTWEKGVALSISLWGLTSYLYGEYRQIKENKKDDRQALLSEEFGAV